MQRVPSRQLTEALSQGTGKTAPDARSAALAELCRAITGLSAHLQDAEDLALLGVLRDAAEKLSPRPAPPAPGLRDFDPTRFQRLLDLAGPSMAGALLAHLQDDLSS